MAHSDDELAELYRQALAEAAVEPADQLTAPQTDRTAPQTDRTAPRWPVFAQREQPAAVDHPWLTSPQEFAVPQQASDLPASDSASADAATPDTADASQSMRLPLPTQTRVFAISNQKGGVGKTTTAVNLAVALAQAGARVLVIDLDPQGNASTALNIDHRSEVTSIYDVMINDVPMADAVQASSEAPNLSVVPATIHLAGAEIELVSLVAREQRLRGSLQRYLQQTPAGYHYIFIDCPPSLGLLTINAFVAANEVLIPIQCEYYALEGLSQLLSNIELIQKHLNPRLRLSTIMLTMYDQRTNLAQQVADEVRSHFPAETLTTIIPRSVRISEAPSYGQTVINYDQSSAGSRSYKEAAAELANRGAALQSA